MTRKLKSVVLHACIRGLVKSDLRMKEVYFKQLLNYASFLSVTGSNHEATNTLW